jgi:glycosyltransferase involved in cell wall biosynthesis
MARSAAVTRRVVYLGHTARLSGAEIGLLRLLQAADAIDAHVLLAEDGPLVEALVAAGATVDVVPMAERARGLKRSELHPGREQTRAAMDVARYIDVVRRRLRDLRPDLVHTNSLKAGVYGSLAARAAGVPSIWHLHDRLATDYLPSRVVRPLRLMASTVPTGLVVPSRTTLATVGARFRPGLHVGVIPLPIPIPDQPVEISDVVSTVGIVGRLTPWKGQHVFLEGFARAFPEGPVKARVIGNAMFGETQYEAQLHDQAAQLGIADRVDFVGFRSDIDAELRQLDVLVHASVLADPLTTVVLEGMAAGLPTVSTNDGGHAEHVTDGVDGLLYPPGDVDGLARALRRLDASTELRQQLAAASRHRAEEFSPQAAVANMLSFYDEVLR